MYLKKFYIIEKALQKGCCMNNCFDAYQSKIESWSQKQGVREDFKAEWYKAIDESRIISQEMAISGSTLIKVIGL